MPRLFISYSSKDRTTAEALQGLLEQNGHKVWRDKTRLEADWSQEIAFGLADAEAICLLWSANSASSKWVKHEWLTARALEKRIFVLFLDEAPLPEPLSTIDGDFTSAAMVDRIRRTTAFHSRNDFTAAAPPVFIPFRPNPDFQGRHADLLELYLGMIGNLKRTGINQMGAVGSGGIGKTQLAVEFAWRFSFAFEAIYWIQANDELLWEQQFVEIARDRLKIEVQNPSSPNARRDYLFALQNYCRQKPNILFILDNVSDPQRLNSDSALDGPPPLDLGASVLFTTRRRFDLPGVSRHPVGILSPLAAAELLTSVRPASSASEKEAVEGICNAAGYLPLAIVLISGLLRKRPRVSYAAYLGELRQKRLGSIDLKQVSAEELATRHLASVEDTLADQWKALVDDSARQLFRLMGFFPEGASVPKIRLGLLAGLEFSDGLVDPLQDAFNELHDLHLMDELEDGAAVSLHPLVWDFAARLVRVSEQTGLKTTAAGKLAQLYKAPARLERHVAARGIDAVVEDLGLAIAWNPDLQEDGRYLHRLLERERHQIARPGSSLFLQLQHRAACLNLLTLSELYANAGTDLLTSFVSRYDDQGLTRSFKGADEEFRTLAISSDGRLALSGWMNLFLWDIGTGRVIRKVSKRLGFTNGAAILADNRHAVYSTDQTLVYLDLHAGEEIWQGREHQREIMAVAVSPDGRTVLTGDEDGVTLLWDLLQRRVVRTFANPGGEVIALAFDSTGLRFLRASSVGSIHLYQIDATEPVREFISDPVAVHRVAFALADSHFVSGTNRGRVMLWDIDDSTPVHQFEHYHRGINSIAVTPDGRFALTASNDWSLILWNLKERDAERRFIGHTAEVHSVAISPDGRSAISGSEDKTLTLWDLTSPQPNHRESHWGRVGAIAFSRDGSRMLSGAADGTIILWDSESGGCLRKFDSGLKDIGGAALSPDLRHALTGDREGDVILWDLDSFQPLRRFEGLGKASEYPLFVDGRPCVLVSEERRLTLQTLETRETVRALLFNEEISLSSFSFMSNGQRALSHTYDRTTGSSTITLWDIDSSRLLRRWESYLFSFYRAGLVRGESQLAVVSGNDDIELFDLNNLKLVARLYTSAGLAALAAHGSTLAVGDIHGIVYFLRV